MNEIIIRPWKQKIIKETLYQKNMVCGRCEMALIWIGKNGASILLFNWGGGNRNWFRRQSKANAIKELEFNWFELLDDKEQDCRKD
jgi:hypothetical protein